MNVFPCLAFWRKVKPPPKCEANDNLASVYTTGLSTLLWKILTLPFSGWRRKCETSGNGNCCFPVQMNEPPAALQLRCLPANFKSTQRLWTGAAEASQGVVVYLISLVKKGQRNSRTTPSPFWVKALPPSLLLAQTSVTAPQLICLHSSLFFPHAVPHASV